MPVGDPVFIYEQSFFKDWMKKKGYSWPIEAWKQENMLAEFQGEGLEEEAFNEHVRSCKHCQQYAYDRCPTGFKYRQRVLERKK